MTVQPLAPDDAVAANLSNGRSSFKRAEVVAALIEVVAAIIAEFAKGGREVARAEVFDNHWLDVAAVRAAGWKVEWPDGYCETYAANFTFKRR